MTHSMCGLRWCARADVIFDVPGRHVLDVEDHRDGRLIVTVESDQVETGCPSCGVIAASHRRRPRMLHDAPCLGRVTMVRWLKRMWRCREPGPGNILRHRHTREWPRKSATIRAPAPFSHPAASPPIFQNVWAFTHSKSGPFCTLKNTLPASRLRRSDPRNRPSGTHRAQQLHARTRPCRFFGTHRLMCKLRSLERHTRGAPSSLGGTTVLVPWGDR